MSSAFGLLLLSGRSGFTVGRTWMNNARSWLLGVPLRLSEPIAGRIVPQEVVCTTRSGTRSRRSKVPSVREPGRERPHTLPLQGQQGWSSCGSAGSRRLSTRPGAATRLDCRGVDSARRHLQGPEVRALRERYRCAGHRARLPGVDARVVCGSRGLRRVREAIRASARPVHCIHRPRTWRARAEDSKRLVETGLCPTHKVNGPLKRGRSKTSVWATERLTSA